MPRRDLIVLRPLRWPPGAGALCSTRQGGVSDGAWGALNLGAAVGDDALHVAENRRRFAAATGARPVWLRQVHRCDVVRLDAAAAQAPTIEADAAWSDSPGIACTIQVADCLPVLFAAADGRAVAAAHAGWRGLAAGVLEATLEALAGGAGIAASAVHTWLGPCIGPAAFEVGADVLEAFGRRPVSTSWPGFAWAPRPDGEPRWRADLAALAHERLRACGVGAVASAGLCTFSDPVRFFSFRRDGVTGRFAAAVWRRSA